MNKNVMVDCETLGTTPWAVVLSVGGHAFDPSTGWIEPNGFYGIVDIRYPAGARVQAARLSVDSGTLLWWMKQKPEAQKVFQDIEAGRGHTEAEVAAGLNGYVGTVYSGDNANADPFADVKLWAHGSSFDIPILQTMFERAGTAWPFQFWNYRDTRTIFDLTGQKVDRKPGVYHNAQDDAFNQAVAINKAFMVLHSMAESAEEFANLKRSA